MTAARRVDRAVVAVLSRALPGHFRARQRAEWSADLAMLAGQGRTVRWRYLLGAARTLPTLRALARRVPADGPAPALPAVSAPVVMVYRVLAICLGWAVLGWLVILPGHYVFDVTGAVAAAGRGDRSIVQIGAELLVAGLVWGAYAVAIELPLVAALAGVAVVLVALERREPWNDRLYVAIFRIAMIVAVAVPLVGLLWFTVLTGPRRGFVLMAAGIAAAGLAVAGRRLSMARRLLLGALGLAAVAIVVINNTIGGLMVVWFLD